MRRLFKYLISIILAILGLLILAVLLLYLPPVQNFLRKKAVEYVSSNYDWEVKVGEFRLGFPLDLTLKEVYAGPTATDTLVSVESLKLKVGLWKIFRKEVSVDDLALDKVKFILSNDSTGLRLWVDVKKLALNAPRISLGKKLAELDFIRLENGSVSLTTGNKQQPDTTVSKPFDWSFVVDRIQFRQVDYRMNTETLPYLGAGVTEGTIVNGKVFIGRQTVEVDSVDMEGAWCNMQTASAKADTETLAVDTAVTLPWTVNAGSLRMENSAFSMKLDGVTTNELILSGIAVRLDSVYNRGTVVRGALRDLQASQQGGAQLTAMRADVDLDTASTTLRGAYIRTPYSELRLDAHTDTSIQGMMKSVPLAVTLDGELGVRDAVIFYKDIPAAILNKKVKINSSFSLTDDRIQVGQLILSMPGNFRLTGSGRISNYKDVKKLAGHFDLRGDLTDVSFVQSYLGNNGVVIPRNMNILTRLQARRGDYEALLRLCCGNGCMELDGSFHSVTEEYAVELLAKQFPLDRFLPADSLGSLSGLVRVEGQHWTWQKARGEVMANISHLVYRRHDYKDVQLQVKLDKTHLRGDLVSRDTAAPFDLIIKGDSIEAKYALDLSGKIGDIDWHALNFVPEPFRVGLNLDIQATMAAENAYTLDLHLDSLKMSDAQRNYWLGSLLLNINTSNKKTELDFASGDLKLKFQADTFLMAFAEHMGKVAQIVEKQINDRDVDMELVQADLPVFDLHVEGAQENAVARFLKARNIGFRNLVADVASRKRSGVRLGIQANQLSFGTVKLDSVQLGAWQTGKSLVYAINAGSSAATWKGLLNINLSGRMQGDQLRVELKQKDAQGQIGFDLGANLSMQDSAFTVNFFPINPILGYSRWIVNADNRIVVRKNGKVNANLRMAYLNKLISLESLENQGNMKDRLQVEIAGVDLEKLARFVPFMPELSGVLSTDVLLYSQDNMLGADGDIRLKDLYYEKQRVGTLDLGLKYVTGENFTRHAVDFELKIDSIRRAIAQGEFATSETNRNIKVDMDIPSLPLYIVNVFLPPGMMRLEGEMTGGVHFRGTMDNPDLNGEVAFRNAKADVVMLGTTFRLDTNKVVVKDGKMVFRKYRFIAPNNSDMILDGDVVLTPFDRMNINLTVNAKNFEVVNVKKNETSLIYGKAYADIQSRISGPFSALSVTGNLNLLNRSDITYTLRASDQSMSDKSIDLVRFVSFRDTSLNEKDVLTNQVNTNSFALRMLVEIGDQVKLGVDLSEDGSNHVNIQGGGNLVLTMNPESGMVLSGKYILTGGTVVYNVPIVGKKEFSIQSGSFVEWTGNIMNPLLNISASEQVKANVVDGEDQTRQVIFESIIRIQNNLSHPDITFDLSAPNDMVIQNQLATFSPEERTRQALNLLIYNTYTAPGAAKSGGSGNMANNAIYSFVENELNKYTRKAGLTVGFDSHNTEDNTTRTDVTYQFSRQLFNDRVRVKIGGRISTDGNDNQGSSLQDNLVDDISIEYILTKRRNLYLKVFRHSNYESVLDGEVIQTGVGIVWRKNFRKFKDLFKNKNREERRNEKQEKMINDEKSKQ